MMGLLEQFTKEFDEMAKQISAGYAEDIKFAFDDDEKTPVTAPYLEPDALEEMPEPEEPEKEPCYFCARRETRIRSHGGQPICVDCIRQILT